MPRPKPDDRSDNVEKIQESLSNTIENREETEDYLQAHRGQIGVKQARQLGHQQEQRDDAIEGFRQEIQDEAEHRRERD